jgi:hypothetical protein
MKFRNTLGLKMLRHKCRNEQKIKVDTIRIDIACVNEVFDFTDFVCL